MRQTVLVGPQKFVSEKVARPRPGPGEVLVRTTHVGICGSDIAAYHGQHPYVPPPIVLGHEFSGLVAELGPGVSSPAVDTPLTVIPHRTCGQCEPCRSKAYNLCSELQVIGCQTPGAHADFVLVPAHMIIPLPRQMSLEDAALVEPAAVSFHALKRADVGHGETVAILGAGPIGVFAMQAARVLGAGAVHMADLDAARLELADSLGADGTIDLSAETLEDGLGRLMGGPQNVDVWAECVGNTGLALDQALRLARRGTRIIAIGILAEDSHVPNLPLVAEHELTMFGSSMYTPDDYQQVIKEMAAGGVRTEGMVTHRFALYQVPQAFEMIHAGAESFFKVMLCSDAVQPPA